MDQGYQMFQQLYLKPIETVARMTARAGANVAKKAVRTAANGVSAATKEAYKRTVSDPYALNQARKRKIMELELEKEYCQKQCEADFERTKKEIIPRLLISGASKEDTQKIQSKIEELAKLDDNPYTTINDCGAIKEAITGLDYALSIGKEDFIRRAIDNLDRIYEARMDSVEHNKDQELIEGAMTDDMPKSYEQQLDEKIATRGKKANNVKENNINFDADEIKKDLAALARFVVNPSGKIMRDTNVNDLGKSILDDNGIRDLFKEDALDKVEAAHKLGNSALIASFGVMTDRWGKLRDEINGNPFKTMEGFVNPLNKGAEGLNTTSKVVNGTIADYGVENFSKDFNIEKRFVEKIKDVDLFDANKGITNKVDDYVNIFKNDLKETIQNSADRKSQISKFGDSIIEKYGGLDKLADDLKSNPEEAFEKLGNATNNVLDEKFTNGWDEYNKSDDIRNMDSKDINHSIFEESTKSISAQKANSMPSSREDITAMSNDVAKEMYGSYEERLNNKISNNKSSSVRDAANKAGKQANEINHDTAQKSSVKPNINKSSEQTK